jgi:predicted permease
MDTLWQDLRYGLRTWSKAPGFTVIVVLTLAFGIGANTTMFAVINTLFLNPLPVARPSELVIVRTVNRGSEAASGDALPISHPNLVDIRARNMVLQAVSGHSAPMAFTTLRGNAPERIFGELVTGNYFETLGLHPARGRFFLPPEDEVPGRAPVLVMAYGAWQHRFGGAADIVGRVLNINGTVFTVIGVAPEHFKGVNAVFGPDVWIPAMMAQQVLPAQMRDWLTDRSALGFRGVARLKAGVTAARAGANLAAIAAALERDYPEPNRGRSVAVDQLTRAALIAPGRLSTTGMSLLLMLVPALVLLIACSNVASLLLARAAARNREIAMRLALGSGARRLMRQLLTESAQLAVVSGAVGFAIAYAGCRLLWSFRPPEVAQNLLDLEIDTTVLMFTAFVSVVTGVIFGLVPAWHSARTDIIRALNDETHSVGGTHRGITLGRLLLAGQVALSLVSLVTAGLLLRSVQQAYRVDPGFEASHLGIVLVGTGQAGYDRLRADQFYRDVRVRLASVPGVVRVSWATNLPLFARPSRSLTIAGREPRERTAPVMTVVNAVDVDYFGTTGIALTRGRDFTGADRADAPPVAVVNQTLAEHYWPNTDPIGRRFTISGESTPREIVGIARTANYGSIGEPPLPCVYVPLQQQFSDAAILYIRTQGDPVSVLPTAQRHIRALDARIEAGDARTIRTLIGQSLFGATIGVGLLGVFGLVALGLACLGLYGAMAHAVRRRQREIGVRMALGAERRTVIRLVLGQGVSVIGAGIAVGLAASLLVGRALAGVLFGVTPADPISLGGASLILVVTAAAACYLPARRASRLDPVQALREA